VRSRFTAAERSMECSNNEYCITRDRPVDACSSTKTKWVLLYGT